MAKKIKFPVPGRSTDGHSRHHGGQRTSRTSQVQGDQLIMSICFWYLVKSDSSSVQFYKVPEKHGFVELARSYYLSFC